MYQLFLFISVLRYEKRLRVTLRYYMLHCTYEHLDAIIQKYRQFKHLG